MIQPKEALTPEMSDKYEEEWRVIINTKGEYTLSGRQARILQREIASGNRGIVMFETFSISIPYIAEFYRVRRFLKGAFQLPARASEEPYKPIPPEKWKKIKKEAYRKIGRKYDKKLRY